MSDKIKAHHSNRNAVLYVRQSSTFQVTHNEESRRLQYAMEQRIRNLGWQEVSVIDEDLGRSASGNVERIGFQRMVAEVCLGQVGVVAAREVSRFARHVSSLCELLLYPPAIWQKGCCGVSARSIQISGPTELTLPCSNSTQPAWT